MKIQLKIKSPDLELIEVVDTLVPLGDVVGDSVSDIVHHLRWTTGDNTNTVTRTVSDIGINEFWNVWSCIDDLDVAR